MNETYKSSSDQEIKLDDESINKTIQTDHYSIKDNPIN